MTFIDSFICHIFHWKINNNLSQDARVKFIPLRSERISVTFLHDDDGDGAGNMGWWHTCVPCILLNLESMSSGTVFRLKSLTQIDLNIKFIARPLNHFGKSIKEDIYNRNYSCFPFKRSNIDNYISKIYWMFSNSVLITKIQLSKPLIN